MQITDMTIPEVKLLTPRRFRDERGFLCETYRRQTFHDVGVKEDFQQDNLSFSASQGTIRGLHFQIPPVAQAKLVFVLRGAILDVAVDVRINAPSYGQYVAQRLDDQQGEQLFIPCGFAHGFVTLEPNTLVYYKISSPYSPEHERGVAWDDPDLGIPWGIPEEDAYLSVRDKRHPRLRDIEPYF